MAIKYVIIGGEVAKRFGKQLKHVSENEAALIFTRALNEGGRHGKKHVRMSLAKRTGVKSRLIDSVMREKRATFNTLAYSFQLWGAETNLNLFDAKQKKRGVSAAPWNKRRVFKGTFFVQAYGGRVFKRETDARGPIEPLYGPNLAREVMREPTVSEWDRAGRYAMKRIDRYLERMLAKSSQGGD